MRTKGTAQELEIRRRIAGRMLQQDYSVAEVAAAVGASQTSVKRWRRAIRDGGGLNALKAKPQPGPQPRLSAAQKKQLVQILAVGAQASGFPNAWWSCSRVAQVIQRRFGVKYHQAHVWKILRRLGWSCQTPLQRARERNAQAIRRWRKRDWPRIKKELATAS